MSVKPLSGQQPNIFSITPSPVFTRTSTTAVGGGTGKSGKAAPVDQVAFSAQALAALKTESPAKPTTAVTKPGTTATDTSGSAEANREKLRLSMEANQSVFDPDSHKAIFDYYRQRMEHHFERNDALRQAFAMPSDIAKGGGIALTGDIAGVIDKTMALGGKPPPDKPAELLAREAERAAGPDPYGGSPPPSEAVKNTSMITLYLPGSQGTGSEQIEIMFDNSALQTLASMSPDAVKDGLVDLMSGSDTAKAGNEAVKNGDFGGFMAENAEWHPEFTSSKARLAVFDPNKGDDRQPMLMIQSETRPDYVREHAGELVDAVMGLLKSLKPAES